MLRLADRKTFIVVPAFEAATLPVAASAVDSKARARMSLDGGQLFQFARHFKRGHAPTNYTRCPCFACLLACHICQCCCLCFHGTAR